MLTLMEGGQLKLAFALLKDAQKGLFYMDGRPAAIAGRAKGLVVEATDEGATFLCAGGDSGWFLLCRLEEL
jgi:hypothetical protein